MGNTASAFSPDGKLSVTLVLAMMQVCNERSEKKNSSALSGGVVPHCPPGEITRQKEHEKQREEDEFEKRECISQKQDKVTYSKIHFYVFAFLSSQAVIETGCSSSPLDISHILCLRNIFISMLSISLCCKKKKKNSKFCS